MIRKVRSSGPGMSLWPRGLAPLPLSVIPSVPTSAYVPGTSKAPVPSGAEAGAVPPVGLEPTTFGLKVRRPAIVWIEHADVLIRNWLARCAAIASNSAIAGNSGNSGSNGEVR